MKECGCFVRIDSELKEKTGDPEASLNWVARMSGECYPRLSYTYRKKKKSGEFHGKETEGTILPTFCPFCGVKYNLKEAAP